MPLIAEHKAALFAARPRVETRWQHAYEPDREHVSPDGGRIFATDRELYHLDASGVTVRTSPNGGPARWLVNLESQAANRRLGLSAIPIGRLRT